MLSERLTYSAYLPVDMYIHDLVVRSLIKAVASVASIWELYMHGKGVFLNSDYNEGDIEIF